MSNDKNNKSDFAVAMARIEELLKPGNTDPYFYTNGFNERRDLLINHCESIVQLVKVAAEMRNCLFDEDGVPYKCETEYDRLMGVDK